jgi:hypothetical protein
MRRWCIDITITVLDFIQCPFFYLKHNVSETGFCLHLQAEPGQFGPKHRAGPETLFGDRDYLYVLDPSE